MKIKEISTTVSKKIGQPDFGSIGFSATITATVEENDDLDAAYAGNWGICMDEIDKQEKLLPKNPVPSQVTPPAPYVDWTKKEVDQTPDPIMDATAPTCGIHGVAMVWKPAGVSKKTGKAYPGFYSCPSRNADGSFCTFRPK